MSSRVVLVGVAAAHIVAGALLLRQRIVPQPPPLPVATLLLAFVAPPDPNPVVSEPPVIVLAVPLAVDAPVVQVAAQVLGPCAPLEAVQAALSAEPAVRAAIAAVPATARSVADAVVVWNTDWAWAAATPYAPLAIVRDTVTRTLASLPARCLAEAVTGPRLILINGGDRSSVLAFGSGTWRWSDLALTVRSS